MPPFSLNAEPRAEAALPGSLGAVTLRHVCEGWPVPGGFVATLAAGAANAASATITTRMLLIAFLLISALKGETTRITKDYAPPAASVSSSANTITSSLDDGQYTPISDRPQSNLEKLRPPFAGRR
jgi:hypothetical protein